LSQSAFFHGPVKENPSFILFDALYLNNKHQIIHNSMIKVQRRMFGKITNLFPYLKRFLKNIKPTNPGDSGTRRHITGKNPHGGGFARAIWPQKTEHLPFINIKGNILYPHMFPVMLYQIYDFNHLRPPNILKKIKANQAFL